MFLQKLVPEKHPMPGPVIAIFRLGRDFHVPNKGESRRAEVRYYGYYPALRDLPRQTQKAKPGGLVTLHPETGRRFKCLSKELGLFEDHACRLLDPDDWRLSPT